MPAKKASSTKKIRGQKKIGLTSAIGPKATTMVVLCVMAGGLALGARQQQAAKTKESAAALASAQIEAPVSTPAKKPAAARAESAAAPAVVRTSAATAPAVTITGCLDRTDDAFLLRDTSGADAPKSRSWKSGFLKKGSGKVEVIDTSRQLPLASQVGHRVMVTGTMFDKQLRADAVRRVAGSCKAS